MSPETDFSSPSHQHPFRLLFGDAPIVVAGPSLSATFQGVSGEYLGNVLLGLDVVCLPSDDSWAERLSEVLGTSSVTPILWPSWHRSARDAGSTPGLAPGRSFGDVMLERALASGSSFRVVIPETALLKGRSGPAKAVLFERQALRALVRVTIPGVLPLVVLDISTDPGSRRVAMLNGDGLLRAGVGPEALAEQVARLRLAEDSQTDFGYSFEWTSAESPLTYESQSPLVRGLLRGFKEAIHTAPLSEFVESCSGGFSKPRRGGRHPTSADDEQVRMLHGRDIPRRGVIDDELEDLDRVVFSRAALHHGFLRDGDIVVANVFQNVLRVAAVVQDLPAVVPGSGVLVLRLKDQYRGLSRFLARFLRSSFVSAWLARNASSPGRTINKVFTNDLLRLPAPAPDGPAVRTAEQLQQATTALEGLVDRFEEARDGIFRAGNVREQLTAAEETAMQAALVTDALATLKDPAALVRRTYPLPIALGWRAIEVELDLRKRYAAGLALAESVVRYLVGMAFADLRCSIRTVPEVATLLEKLTAPARGPTMGEWIQVLARLPAADEERVLRESAFPELRLAMADPASPLAGALNVLKNRRNVWAHNRGLSSDSDYERESPALMAELQGLIEALRFTVKYPLRHIVESHFDPLSGTRSATIRELVGDHYLTSVRAIATPGQLGKDHLYFVDQWGGSQLASPWLMYGVCPVCKHREVRAPSSGPDRDARTRGVVYSSLSTEPHPHPAEFGELDRLIKFLETPRDSRP